MGDGRKKGRREGSSQVDGGRGEEEEALLSGGDSKLTSSGFTVG